MPILRWLFVLFLSVAVDAVPPHVPNAGEAFETMEEEVHPGRQRGGLRRAPITGAAPVAHEAQARLVRRPEAKHPAPTAPANRVRKLPPATSDSASASEDQ